MALSDENDLLREEVELLNQKVQQLGSQISTGRGSLKDYNSRNRLVLFNYPTIIIN